jgi:CRISPR-associated protein Cas6
LSLWQEKDDQAAGVTQATLSDVVFKIECQSLPVDHASALTDALCERVPWLATLAGAGVHPIHVAGSQNGWQRPQAESGEPLILSKRTRLRVRLPTAQADRLITDLTNTTHNLASHRLKVTSGRATALLPANTLFSRYTIYSARPENEEAFIRHVQEDCASVTYRPTKLLCGKSHHLSTADGVLEARSLLIADVPPEYSTPLQEKGLGDYRLIGCGILIPHKDTGAVS